MMHSRKNITFITLLTATYFHQQYRRKGLLRFHGNNGSAKSATMLRYACIAYLV